MSSKGRRKILLLAILPSLLAAALFAPPAAAQGSPGDLVYKTQEGSGYELYEDGTLIIGGDMNGSCDTVLQEVRQTGAKPDREILRQVEICEEAGFHVPGSESLPETSGPPLLIVAALGLLVGCPLLLLGTRR